MDADNSPNAHAEQSLALIKVLPPDLLLIVFIHGFKGTDSTFLGFPERLKHVAQETIENVVVESIVFPAYETKGELTAAVERFADWLATLTVEREVARGEGGGAGKAKIVLCGHSMGGLVAADTLINLATSRPDKAAPLWPRIIALIAFDTPYLGLHPFVFKNSATKAFGYVQTARDVATSLGMFANLNPSQTPPAKAPVAAITAPPSTASASSSWMKWAPAVGGVLASGAVAGAAYWKRKDLGEGYQWATDHMKYVGTLWNEDLLKTRMERILEIEQTLGVVFRNFYTRLPAKPPQQPEPRTFIILPKGNPKLRAHFSPAENTIAEDEVQAHMGMFEAPTNDGYYELGLAAARIIREVVVSGRGMIQGAEAAKGVELKAEETLKDDMSGNE
ncbi:hypothetical protein BD410DRAFT_893134 [Rickenella mellea]|uniref:DUF676 domain-containing protein n=1 Tax=Rickenella mellea TaxID=50990 RepID=A0A4R5XI01_9AGAM|nr:hypothetical protein BD410DRAFT_893134 [Rickenella mellea]